MTAVVSTTNTDPFSQFWQLGSVASALLSSLCQKTETAFCRVQTLSRNASGAEVLHHWIEERATGALFLDVDSTSLRIKCGGVIFGIVPYTVSMMVWQVFKTTLIVISIAAETLNHSRQLLCQGAWQESAHAVQSGIARGSVEFCQGLYAFVKAPPLALGCALTALHGFVKPYHAMKFEAMLEKIWQNGVSYTEDGRYVCDRLRAWQWEGVIQDMQTPHPCYLAWCFQVRANSQDSNLRVIARKEI